MAVGKMEDGSNLKDFLGIEPKHDQLWAAERTCSAQYALTVAKRMKMKGP
jgi:hypothetical protein